MITIVGGSGFIGSRLSKRLMREQIPFQIVDKRMGKTFPERTKIADVRHFNQLMEAIDGDIIVNLAAEHRDDISPKRLYDDVNVEGAKRICEVAEEKEINKIIFTSSIISMIMAVQNMKLSKFIQLGKKKVQKLGVLLL